MFRTSRRHGTKGATSHRSMRTASTKLVKAEIYNIRDPKTGREDMVGLTAQITALRANLKRINMRLAKAIRAGDTRKATKLQALREKTEVLLQLKAEAFGRISLRDFKRGA